MIALRRLCAPIILSSFVLALSACGNDKSASRATGAVKEVIALAKLKMSGKKIEAPQQVDPQIAISKTLEMIPDAPLQFVYFEASASYAITSIYGVNGDVTTWLSADKKSTSFERGMLTATRGFGNDLMSVEDGGAVRLISGRGTGSVTKIYRFLNGVEHTGRLTMTCDITPAGQEKVDSGEISTMTTIMAEICRGADVEVKNIYWIDAQGRMIQSAQWSGAANGTMVFRRLRF